ncbi:PD-(D/E)XK motif protein [Flavicella sp.]|uniref:PD-(D/E)XK motif protein n=1 Tax=Flavicella sp. TaxID=2957742 RepID=UPI00262C14FE|nr:PD-(D/E)XK motif protein [Flavicella sp.]MDG1805919.1 PD-(D/E)XK motif protein [Flavicella sp.]
MTIENLENKWLKLEKINSGDNPWVYLILDEDCVPKLNIAINDKNNRCVLLKTDGNISFKMKEIIQENIKFSYSKIYKQYVLELLDGSFSDLFDELIISLYNKIHNESDTKKTISIFTATIIKWISFFNKGTSALLSEVVIRGLFGELIALKDYLISMDNRDVNEILDSWQGPYNSPTDFVFDNALVEVKTKRIDASIVKISSAYQLEEEEGKSLTLRVVSLETTKDSLETISTVFLDIKNIIFEKSGDLGVFINALNGLGISYQTITTYDNYCYTPKEITDYNCLLENKELSFPRISSDNLPKQITKVKYHLNLHTLGDFIITTKKI